MGTADTLTLLVDLHVVVLEGLKGARNKKKKKKRKCLAIREYIIAIINLKSDRMEATSGVRNLT